MAAPMIAPDDGSVRMDIQNAASIHQLRSGATTAARWYVVNTHPYAEKRAVTNLERQGWPCFCPLVSRTSRQGTRLLTQLRPLFPGYVFVSLDPGRSRWRSVDSSFGVRSIVKHGDLPAPLPEGCVDALMKMSDGDGVFSFASRFSLGDRVQFLSGPFSGFVGSLETLDPQGRIVVLLDLLGRQSRVRAAVTEIAPALKKPA